MGGVTEKKLAAQKEEQRQMERRVRYGARKFTKHYLEPWTVCLRPSAHNGA